MSNGRRWGLVWIGGVAVIIGLLLFVTPAGVHHSGVCGSVVSHRHPLLNNEANLEEQVQADADCGGELAFRAWMAGLVSVGGAAVAIAGVARRT
jgi:hypothetical protein